jgi:pyruvate,water dikinase
MRSQYLFDLNDPRLPKTVGNKARNLRFLTRKGFRVPSTFAVTWDAYLRYSEEDPEPHEILKAELSDLLDPEWPYAVRSSASIEDQLHHFLAGQSKSVLNLRGVSEVLEAIRSIWATSRAPLPRMLVFFIIKLRFGRRVEAFLPAMERQYRAIVLDDVGQLSENELIDEIERLNRLTQETAYYNIVAPLLMQAYNRALRGLLGRLGIDLDELELTDDLEQLERFDPNVHLLQLHCHYRALDEEAQARIRHNRYRDPAETPGVGHFREELENSIERFGHLRDSGNDSSSVPCREDPDLILRMVANHTVLKDRSSAKVIQSLQDFGSLREGDVLTVPYSDVGWTPLIAKAGAVIAESGGSLSHSSIVAREYNIPAVVSIPGPVSSGTTPL